MCHVELTEDNCRPSIFKKGSGYCNPCINEWQKRWYRAHPDYAREKRRRYWTLDRRLEQRRKTQEFKRQAMDHYSNGKMACTNPYAEHDIPYTNVLALTIDHITGGGTLHRKSLRYSSIYQWLVVEGFPKGYQVLCMNCQLIKRSVNKEMPFNTTRPRKNPPTSMPSGSESPIIRQLARSN